MLALDENGHAAAWIKSYVGPPGSGFVRLEADGRDPARLALVAAIAELFPTFEDAWAYEIGTNGTDQGTYWAKAGDTS